MEDNANLNPGVPQPVDPPPPQVPPADQGAVYTGSSPKKKIISILIGIFAVGLLLVLVFKLILPMLFKPTAENAEITYWGLWEDEAIFKTVIDEFEAEHPNIKVKYEKHDIKNVAGGGYLGFVKSRMQNGTGPDVFRYHTGWSLFLNGYLAPFPDDVVKELDFKANYYPVIDKDMQMSGAYYGVPLGIDTLVMFVNDEILQAGGYEVPQNWDKFMDIARALTVVDEQTGEIKTAGTALGTYDNVAHAADILSLLMVQNGVDLGALAGYTTGNEEEIAKKQATAKKNMGSVLDFYTCFAQKNDICTPVWNNSMPNSKLAFVEGKLAFYFGYSWDILEIKQPQHQNLKFSVHPVPKLSSSGPAAATLTGYWVEGVSRYSKHQKAAFEFLKFLSKKESMEKIYKAQASQRPVAVAYPRSDMSTLLQDVPYLTPVVFQASNAQSTIFYGDTFGGGPVQTLDLYLGNAVRGIITQSNRQSTETAVDTLAKGMAEVFKEYVK